MMRNCQLHSRTPVRDIRRANLLPSLERPWIQKGALAVHCERPRRIERCNRLGLPPSPDPLKSDENGRPVGNGSARRAHHSRPPRLARSGRRSKRIPFLSLRPGHSKIGKPRSPSQSKSRRSRPPQYLAWSPPANHNRGERKTGCRRNRTSRHPSTTNVLVSLERDHLLPSATRQPAEMDTAGRMQLRRTMRQYLLLSRTTSISAQSARRSDPLMMILQPLYPFFPPQPHLPHR